MITIRKAIKSDAQTIYDLRSRAIIEKCSAYYSKEQLSLWTQGGVSDGFVQDVFETFYVSEIDDQVVGSGKLNTERGAAKQMLVFLEELAKHNGLKLLKLESTLNAAPFYRSCGFAGEEVSTYHSPRGISLDCIPMEKSLGQLA